MPKSRFITLKDAPSGKILLVSTITGHDLALELAKTGLQEGVEIVKSREKVPLTALRVRGPKGDAILSGKMASMIMVHLDDGSKAPLMDLKPGEQGHVEGLTATTPLTKAFAILGLKEDDRITLLRRLPPMAYITLINQKKRIKIPEATAAKIWGRMGGVEMQFCSAQKGARFEVLELFGGPPRKAQMKSLGLEKGAELILEGVEGAQTVSVGEHHPVYVTTKDGLRILLHPQAARNTMVQVKD